MRSKKIVVAALAVTLLALGASSASASTMGRCAYQAHGLPVYVLVVGDGVKRSYGPLFCNAIRRGLHGTRVAMYEVSGKVRCAWYSPKYALMLAVRSRDGFLGRSACVGAAPQWNRMASFTRVK